MQTPPPPPLDVVGPDGRRTRLQLRHGRVRARSLRLALGLDRLSVDGRPVIDDEILPDVDELCVGAQVSELAGGDDRAAAGDGDRRLIEPLVDVAVVAGPACTGWKSLSRGRHVVGRSSTSAILVDDETVELHHGIVDVDTAGAIAFTQLAGLQLARLEGRPVAAREPIPLGHPLRLGTSTLVFRAAPATRVAHPAACGALRRHPSDPWRRIVRRAPPIVIDEEPPRLVAPADMVLDRWPPTTGLIGAGIAGVSAGVMAIVMNAWWFAFVGGLGAVGGLATWVTGVVATARRRCRARRAHAATVSAFDSSVRDAVVRRRECRIRSTPTMSDTLSAILESAPSEASLGDGVWARRLSAGRALCVSIGRGTEHWSPTVDSPDDRPFRFEHLHRIDDVPATVSLERGSSIAVAGPTSWTHSLARSMVVQLATWWGPADWRLVVVARDRHAWDWVSWLPHSDGRSVIDPAGSAALLADGDTDRVTVVVTDDPELVTMRTGPVRRFVETTDAAAVVLVGVDEVVPAFCTETLSIGTTGACRWSGDVDRIDDVDGIRLSGTSRRTAETVATRLAPLADPELDLRRQPLPASVRLSELADEPCSAGGVARRWRTAGSDPAPVAAVGRSADGPVEIDLARDGPHGLIAGTTGAGKSELLRSLVVGLACRVPPSALSFVLVDFKGGSTFDACARLPHTVGLVTDLDDRLAVRALRSFDAELRRRERLFRAVGVTDLVEYRGQLDVEPIARLAIVVDEFAALAQEVPDFLPSLVAIAQRGRSLGVHLILATQRPAGVVSDAIRANTNLRLALRLHDRADALDIVGDERPVHLPRRRPGAAVLRLGPHELIEFQSATCTVPVVESPADVAILDVRDQPTAVRPDASAGAASGATELEQMCDAVIEAASSAEWDLPHRPWIEPLPEHLTTDDVLADLGRRAIGVIDDPDHQRRRALDWHPSDGNLALLGPRGAGTSTTLMAIVARICSSAAPSDLHVYVVDARGDDRWAAFDGLAHVGAVVRVGDDERIQRLLLRLEIDLDGRIAASNASQRPRVALVVDGLSSTFRALDGVDGGRVRALLDRVVDEGPAVGIACAFSDRETSVHPASERWVSRPDRADVSRPDPHARSTMPGRFRLESTGEEAQVAAGLAGLADLPDRSSRDDGPPPIGVLPAEVDAADLVDARTTIAAAGTGRIAVGRCGDSLGPAILRVGASDHVLVLGEPGSGVSTAARRCAIELAARHGDVPVIELTGDEDRDERLAAIGGRAIVFIDDADRVDDPSGALTRAVQGGHSGVTIVAGGRLAPIRSAYGHWTRQLAQARCGLVMAQGNEIDGDVFGVALPRRSLVAARPGLAWLIDRDRIRLAQIARN